MTRSYAYRHGPSQAQGHNVTSRVCKPLGMGDDNSLPVRRLRLFLAQYEQEHGYGWQTRLSQLTGRHQTHLGRMAKGERGPGLDDVTAIVRELGVNERFFYDERLGDAPDYRDFVGTRTERDDETGTPNAEAYIAGQAATGRPVSDEHAKRLRSIRLSTGDMPIGAFEAAHRGWLAEDVGKVVARGEPLKTKVDEARGQRRLPPSKPRR